MTTCPIAFHREYLSIEIVFSKMHLGYDRDASGEQSTDDDWRLKVIGYAYRLSGNRSLPR